MLCEVQYNNIRGHVSLALDIQQQSSFQCSVLYTSSSQLLDANLEHGLQALVPVAAIDFCQHKYGLPALQGQGGPGVKGVQ
jgi:hypothetical protein